MARHQQTWKLREYHLIMSDSGIVLDLDSNVIPLPAGDPLRSFFPTGTHIKEDREGLTVRTPQRSGSLRYQRASRMNVHSSKHKEAEKVVDVILMGEVWFLTDSGVANLITPLSRATHLGDSLT